MQCSGACATNSLFGTLSPANAMVLDMLSMHGAAGNSRYRQFDGNISCTCRLYEEMNTSVFEKCSFTLCRARA
jgi:hypothetical protein